LLLPELLQMLVVAPLVNVFLESVVGWIFFEPVQGAKLLLGVVVVALEAI